MHRQIQKPLKTFQNKTVKPEKDIYFPNKINYSPRDMKENPITSQGLKFITCPLACQHDFSIVK